MSQIVCFDFLNDPEYSHQDVCLRQMYLFCSGFVLKLRVIDALQNSTLTDQNTSMSLGNPPNMMFHYQREDMLMLISDIGDSYVCIILLFHCLICDIIMWIQFRLEFERWISVT